MWAAGNGGDVVDSCAADGYSNSIYTIAVGAANSNGSAAYYDERCSGKMVVTLMDDQFALVKPESEILKVVGAEVRYTLENRFYVQYMALFSPDQHHCDGRMR